MSWSISVVGRPDAIVSALKNESDRLTAASKAEFDEALPHLVALLRQNYNKNGDPVLELTANGHGVIKTGTGEREYCSCNVSLNAFSKRIV